ncbi:MAG: MarR family winged helix-turn-helix transcriptional regulator [Cohaesibacteraceae bacterium]
MTDALTNDVTDQALPSDDALEELRRTNLGKLLDEVHVGFDKLALQYLHEAGYPDLRAAHTHVLRTMRMEGSTLTDMAERAGISKQAMSKLVAVFEQWGYVEWRGDYGRQVYATDAGKQLLKHGVLALRAAEETFFAALGPHERETLRALLLRTVDAQQHQPLIGWRRRRA